MISTQVTNVHRIGQTIGDAWPLVAVDRVHDLVAGEDPPWAAGEVVEDLKFRSGQGDGFPVHGNFVPARVYRQVVNLNGFSLTRQVFFLAPQDGPNPCEQYPGAEGFCYVVIGPEFESGWRRTARAGT